MTKGKKQALTLVGLCLLMAVAIGLYYFVPQGEKNGDGGENQSQTVKVCHIESDQICAISVSRQEGESLSLKKDEEVWKLEDLPEVPVNQSAVENMYAPLSSVTANKEMTGEQVKKQEYGLESPQMTVKITTESGETYEFYFGDEVPVTGGKYGMTADSSKVYAFADTLFDAFDVKKNALIEKEEISGINADYLTKISIKNKKKTTFQAEVVSDDKKVDAYTNWVISKPYAKPLAGSSTEAWSTLQGYFTDVSFDELIEYQCRDLKKYGLDQPVAEIQIQYFELKDGYEIPEEKENVSTVGKSTNKANVVPKKYQDKKGYLLSFGAKDEKGDYYVSLNHSGNVYTMEADTAKSMMEADAYTYMDHSVYSTLATDIKGYEVTIGNSGKKIHVTHETKKGDDGKDKNIWMLNGKQVPEEQEEAFLTPYSKAFLLEFTSEAKDSVKPDSDQPVLTAVYHEDGRDVTVRYLPYDGTNFYRVDKSGMDYFLVDKMSVDAVIDAFESLLDLDLQEKK